MKALKTVYPPYYRLEINPDGSVRVFSDSKYIGGRELKQWLRGGYLMTGVKMPHREGNDSHIHHIVAEIFYGIRPEGLVITHKDGNKLNNHPDNLEYCTQAENVAHSIAMGLHVCCTPERLPSYIDGRCSKENRAEYKAAWYLNNKEKQSQLAKKRYWERKRVK